MSKHTPGPWKAEKSKASDNWCVQKEVTIANVINYPKQMKANAHLIASAPELLEACKSMLWTHGMHGPCEMHSCQSCELAYKKAKQAIAKAEGGK